MRILIIDQCSKAKNTPESFPPLDADDIDSAPRESLLEDSDVPRLPAKKLYGGRQQKYVSEAVDRLREAGDDVTRVIISAGFGVVDEDTPLPPYNVTFNDYTASEIDERSEKLGISDDIRTLTDEGEPYDIVFFPLGTKYYRSIDVEKVVEGIPSDTLVVLFNQESLAEKYPNVLSLPARTPQAKEFGTIVVALKGQYLKHFAEHRSHGESVSNLQEVKEFCEQSYTTQTGLDAYD